MTISITLCEPSWMILLDFDSKWMVRKLRDRLQPRFLGHRQLPVVPINSAEIEPGEVIIVVHSNCFLICRNRTRNILCAFAGYRDLEPAHCISLICRRLGQKNWKRGIVLPK